MFKVVQGFVTEHLEYPPRTILMFIWFNFPENSSWHEISCNWNLLFTFTDIWNMKCKDLMTRMPVIKCPLIARMLILLKQLWHIFTLFWLHTISTCDWINRQFRKHYLFCLKTWHHKKELEKKVSKLPIIGICIHMSQHTMKIATDGD